MSIFRRARPFLLAAAVAGLLGDLGCVAQILGLDDLHAGAQNAAATSAETSPEGGTGTACTSNAQCIASATGNLAFCVTPNGASHGNCVNLDRNLCYPYVYPPPPSTDMSGAVALIAAFIPLYGGAAPLTQPPALAYELALDELNLAGGIPPSAPGDPLRQVAMIFCASDDVAVMGADGGTSTYVDEAMRHVAEDLQVPAVIAGFDDNTLARWIDTYGAKGTAWATDGGAPQIFTLNPGVSTNALKYADTGQLLWNLLGTPEDVALAYRPLLLRTETYVRNRRPSAAQNDPVKVALLVTDTDVETLVADTLLNGAYDFTTLSYDPTKALEFNDASTEANADAGDFLLVSNISNETPDYSGIENSLMAFRPDVIIALTLDEVAQIVTDYEGTITDQGALPIWLLSYRNADVPGLLDYLGEIGDAGVGQTFGDKQERFFGVQYAGTLNTQQYDAWLERMTAAYSNSGIAESQYSAVENFYDAVYWLAYGLAAAGPGAPTSGGSIGDGVRALLTGPEITPGTVDEVQGAFNAIYYDTNTTYVGALGPPDISEKFGTWNSVGGVYCYNQNFDGSVAPQYDVFRYDSATGELDDENSFCFISNPSF